MPASLTCGQKRYESASMKRSENAVLITVPITGARPPVFTPFFSSKEPIPQQRAVRIAQTSAFISSFLPLLDQQIKIRWNRMVFIAKDRRFDLFARKHNCYLTEQQQCLYPGARHRAETGSYRGLVLIKQPPEQSSGSGRGKIRA